MSAEEIHAAHIASIFLNTLTPKFYVILTGTSSLVSGLILIFEWWYFKKYGTSFMERFSLSHISTWFTGKKCSVGSEAKVSSKSVDSNSDVDTDSSNSEFCRSKNGLTECKVWRNPMSLFRGAEYYRYYKITGREPLTYYDMNLSAQDHQSIFTCESDKNSAEYEVMQAAWRERDNTQRINLAKEALEKNPECTTALILLAEEEASTIVEAEKYFKQALKSAENNFKGQSYNRLHSTDEDGHQRRDTSTYIHIKKRLGMCARKLLKLKEASRLLRDLVRECAAIGALADNLIECLLEMRAYADLQNLMLKLEDLRIPNSAVFAYTAALLKARSCDIQNAASYSRKSLSQSEASTIKAMRRAIAFNPHVPQYLLERKALSLPPEHILRRGDSEAVSYAFFHIIHWKRVPSALTLLECVWEGSLSSSSTCSSSIPGYVAAVDRQLLPPHHKLSVYPKRELPLFILLTAVLSCFTSVVAIFSSQYPKTTLAFAGTLLDLLSYPVGYLLEKLEIVLPSNIIHYLSQI